MFYLVFRREMCKRVEIPNSVHIISGQYYSVQHRARALSQKSNSCDGRDHFTSAIWFYCSTTSRGGSGGFAPLCPTSGALPHLHTTALQRGVFFFFFFRFFSLLSSHKTFSSPGHTTLRPHTHTPNIASSTPAPLMHCHDSFCQTRNPSGTRADFTAVRHRGGGDMSNYTRFIYMYNITLWYAAAHLAEWTRKDKNPAGQTIYFFWVGGAINYKFEIPRFRLNRFPSNIMGHGKWKIVAFRKH